MKWHDSGQPVIFPSLNGSGMPPGVITSLLPDGTTNPAALNIELDLPQYWGHTGGGDISSYLRIWGLSLLELGQAFNLAIPTRAVDIKIFGGMAQGYPLADPTQQGIITQGQINQAFGNWLGTDMTLDMYIRPPASGSAYNPDNPLNFTFTWSTGQTLKDAIAATLSKAMPGVQQNINVNANRVPNATKTGYYASFSQFATMIQEMTAGELGSDDMGVVMAHTGSAVNVYEGTPGPPPTTGITQIKFQDLLGQVTWAAPNQLTAKLVMRGDLNISDWIQFPQGLVATTTASALPAFGGTGANPSNNLTFSGKFQIAQIQHWGNFRNPDALSWNTTIWANLQPQQGSGATSTSM